MSTAYFAAGCFWGVEARFQNLPGVQSTKVGYAGGSKENPTYKEVCTGTTGHAETLKVEFDPDQVSFKKLLEVFWDIHDPTTKNRQGPDVGSQYRSAIFYTSEDQKEEALNSIKELNSSGRYNSEIVTEVTPYSHFYEAEEYHQCYFQKQSEA